MATAELNAPPVPRREPYPRPWTEAEFRTMRALGLFPGRSVELVGGRVVEHLTGEPSPQPYLFDRGELLRLTDAGLFRDERVMLIDGEVLAVSPMNPDHANALLFALDALRLAFGPGHTYRPQLPMDLGQRIDPEPDIAILAGPPQANRGTPRAALLVVEVADTTLAYDVGDKASLYAAGGITDYWVIDLVNRRLVVFRDPQPDAARRFGHGYARQSAHGPADAVAPLAAPGSPVRVADLLP